MAMQIFADLIFYHDDAFEYTLKTKEWENFF